VAGIIKLEKRANMEDAINFIQAFIGKEYEALVAQWTERDDSIFEEKRNEVRQFYGAYLTPEVNRPEPVDNKWFKKGKKYLDMIQPRVLFQVKQYEQPTLGNLYRCYVSTTQRDDNNYFSCLYIGNTEQGVKIVAQYNTDFEGGWNWRGGVKLDTLGKLIEVRKFQAPTDPENLKDYEAE
jgi:hypothetical protein